MPTFNLNAIRAGIATVLGSTVAGNVYTFPTPIFTTPCLIVRLESIRFDATFVRGADEATFRAWYVVGLANESAAWDSLSAAIDGAAGFKQTLEAQPGTLNGSVATVRVTDAEVEYFLDGQGATYLSMRYDFEVLT